MSPTRSPLANRNIATTEYEREREVRPAMIAHRACGLIFASSFSNSTDETKTKHLLRGTGTNRPEQGEISSAQGG